MYHTNDYSTDKKNRNIFLTNVFYNSRQQVDFIFFHFYGPINPSQSLYLPRAYCHSQMRNDGMPDAHRSAGRSAAGRFADGSRRQPRRRRHLSVVSSSAPAPATAPASSPTFASASAPAAAAAPAGKPADCPFGTCVQHLLVCIVGRSVAHQRKRPSCALQYMAWSRGADQCRLFMLNDAPPGATRPGHQSCQKVAEVDTCV